MIILIVGLAFLLLTTVLLLACRKSHTEQPPTEPDSFELELRGYWPCDHKHVRL
jgi:hypothetical protein